MPIIPAESESNRDQITGAVNLVNVLAGHFGRIRADLDRLATEVTELRAATGKLADALAGARTELAMHRILIVYLQGRFGHPWVTVAPVDNQYPRSVQVREGRPETLDFNRGDFD